MRALIFTSSPFDQTVIPRVADEQIVTGPHWPDAQDLDGRWLSLRAPTGAHELEVVLSKIPDYQWPDRIIFLSDPTQLASPSVEVFDISRTACA